MENTLEEKIERLKSEIRKYEKEIKELEKAIKSLEKQNKDDERLKYKNVILESEINITQKQLELLKQHSLLNIKKIKPLKLKLKDLKEKKETEEEDFNKKRKVRITNRGLEIEDKYLKMNYLAINLEERKEELRQTTKIKEANIIEEEKRSISM